MITVVVALPLLGFLVAGLFGRQIGDRASEIVTTSFLMVSAVLSWVLFSSTRSARSPRRRPCSATGSRSAP